MATSQTKPSTPRLSEVARHVVVPSGVVSTGWPAVQAKCRDLGIGFDPWQDGAGRIILAKRADGKYAATVGGTGLSIPRQVGKTFLVGAIVFALCLLFPGLTVIWTAHRLRTAGETFDKMQGFARRKRIAPHVAKIVLGSGEEEIRFRNGSRILFGARERGFGRGFDEVDVLIFDEAQILTENAIDDMVPATNQSRQAAGALMLFMGTPPKPTDTGEVFTRMRAEALSGEDEDTGWIELSADPGFKPSESPAPMTAEDWRQIAKANPSYPKRTPREAVLRMRKKLTPESMSREGFGIWDEVAGSGVVDMAVWNSRRADAPGGAPFAFAVDMTWDREWASIGVCVESYVDVIEHRRGAAWVIEYCKALQAKHDAPVVILAKGPAAGLIQPLREAGVGVRELSNEDYQKACGTFFDAVSDGSLTHSAHPVLDAAVAGAVASGGASGWVWDRKKGAVISPLAAVTVAWSQRRGVYESRELLVF